ALLQCGIEHATVFERDIPQVPVTANTYVYARRQRVHNRDTHTVEPTGNRIPAAAKFPAGVHDRHDHLNGAFIFGGVNRHGNTAAVIFNALAAIFLDGDVDRARVAGQGLIHRDIHDLIDQVVVSTFRGGADIHARTYPNCLETFQD